jgi:hypothetical protein
MCASNIGLPPEQPDIRSKNAAITSLQLIDNAIAFVANERARLAQLKTRFEQTITISENYTDADIEKALTDMNNLSAQLQTTPPIISKTNSLCHKTMTFLK